MKAGEPGGGDRNILDAMLRHPTPRRAYRHIRRVESRAIFNHSVRTFLYAFAAATRNGHLPDAESLFVACLFHDVGTVPAEDGMERFEVEGADAASRFLAEQGWQQSRIAEVWQAIALHTSPGIAERFGGITRLVRLGVLIDFGDRELIAAEVVRDAERGWARLDIERTLSDAVIASALLRPTKAPPGSWPGALVEARLANPTSPDINPAF